MCVRPWNTSTLAMKRASIQLLSTLITLRASSNKTITEFCKTFLLSAISPVLYTDSDRRMRGEFKSNGGRYPVLRLELFTELLRKLRNGHSLASRD